MLTDQLTSGASGSEICDSKLDDILISDGSHLLVGVSVVYMLYEIEIVYNKKLTVDD